MPTINRREFLSTAAMAAAAALLTTRQHRLLAGEQDTPAAVPDLAVVKGVNYYDATVKAVDMLGGMKRFVPRGSRVGLLVNSRFDKPGTFVKPQIALAVAVMCMDAGAREIVSLEDVSGSYWRRATLAKEHHDLVQAIKEPGGYKEMALQGGKRLKSVEVVQDLLDCDVYINVPVFKDHEGTHFTGSLKNLMGATSSSTNRFFHKGSGASGYYDDPEHLSECIAEANQIRRPSLCIGDGTEVITTNGPSGPGRMIRPQMVVAGTDGVAFDAFGATMLSLNPDDITMIRRASELGMGSKDLSKLTIARAML